MRIGFLFLFVIIAIIVSTQQVDAHVAKVIEDYKIDAGWLKEPPIVGEKNAIEIIISLATNYDKQKYDQIFGTIISEKSNPSKKDISELEDDLEVSVAIAGEKTFLKLEEDSSFPGIYYGEYTPISPGKTKVHIFGIINAIEFEATFNPEKVEKNPLEIEIANSSEPKSDEQKSEIPNWIRNNAKWWADGAITDSDFISGIQYLITNGIMNIPQTYLGESTGKSIPDWVKQNAGWWGEGQIEDSDFLNGIQYLVKNGIIIV